MTNKEACHVLELMAVDLTGAISGMPRTSPMLEVLQQRIDAIDRAQNALIYWDEHLQSLNLGG